MFIVSFGGMISYRTWSVRHISRSKEQQTNLQPPHTLHILFTLPRRPGLRPVKSIPLLKKLRFTPCTRTSKALRHLTHHILHHGEVLEVVVRLEERDTGVELD